MINFKNYTKAKVWVHFMPWFNTSGHVSLNYTTQAKQTLLYDSANPVICADQCQRMLAAGIAGVNFDYYHSQRDSSEAVLRMINAVEQSGLQFFVCVDQGAIPAGDTGTAANNDYIEILNYCRHTFFKSSSYLLDSTGRPIVNFFGEPASVNWTTIRAGVPQSLALVFENGVGFTHAESDGAFGWVNPTTPASNINTAAITTFDNAAIANPTKLAFFPVYPGFDDSLASWGTNRFMTRGSGQTLLTTLSMVPSTAQHVMVATWNDHEEGSNIEEAASWPG